MINTIGSGTNKRDEHGAHAASMPWHPRIPEQHSGVHRAPTLAVSIEPGGPPPLEPHANNYATSVWISPGPANSASSIRIPSHLGLTTSPSCCAPSHATQSRNPPGPSVPQQNHDLERDLRGAWQGEEEEDNNTEELHWYTKSSILYTFRIPTSGSGVLLPCSAIRTSSFCASRVFCIAGAWILRVSRQHVYLLFPPSALLLRPRLSI
ncbi:hypothetical protein B0H11DRAFT_1932511 [Mycena galericulata]|nr:hypothetical protein B0H11DRAFT_1932511 [Mycena galericulata]